MWFDIGTKAALASQLHRNLDRFKLGRDGCLIMALRVTAKKEPRLQPVCR